MNDPIKLPPGADELLRDLPVTEPDFEAQAKAIQARLHGSPGGVVFDDLLRAPELEPEPGEPGEVAAPSKARTSAPKSNFAEMARKSVQKGKDDAAELTKELLAATAQSRRPDAQMVERVRAASRMPAPPTATPLPVESNRTSGVVSRVEAAAPGAASAAPAVAALAPVTAPSSGTKRGVVVGFIGGALAVAACALLFLRTGQSEPPHSAALVAERSPEPAAEAAKPAAARAGAKASDNGSEGSAEGIVSPEALAATPGHAPRGAMGGSLAGLGAPGSPAAAPALTHGAKSAAPAPNAAATSKGDAVVLEDDPEPQKPPPAVEKKAEPVQEPAMKPAEGNTDSVPLNPSAGAVSTALSGVRGGAQACLAGQTDPVTAVITFAADGHVLGVKASGPSGACIQAALSRAHIAPFAKPTFNATTTIRPP